MNFTPSTIHIRSHAHSLMRFAEARARTRGTKNRVSRSRAHTPHTPLGRAYKRRPGSVVRACANERANTTKFTQSKKQNTRARRQDLIGTMDHPAQPVGQHLHCTRRRRLKNIFLEICVCRFASTPLRIRLWPRGGHGSPDLDPVTVPVTVHVFAGVFSLAPRGSFRYHVCINMQTNHMRLGHARLEHR